MAGLNASFAWRSRTACDVLLGPTVNVLQRALPVSKLPPKSSTIELFFELIEELPPAAGKHVLAMVMTMMVMAELVLVIVIAMVVVMAPMMVTAIEMVTVRMFMMVMDTTL